MKIEKIDFLFLILLLKHGLRNFFVICCLFLGREKKDSNHETDSVQKKFEIFFLGRIAQPQLE